jgi:ABC-2 type transport system permease protein
MRWLRIQQEIIFLFRSKALMAAFGLAFLLGSIAVLTGLAVSAEQEREIMALIELDRSEREFARSQASDYGDAAYSTFYAAWNPPSELAFAAIGQRDLSPIVMRVRALALEGQIYETDSINPELALSGRFDYAFYAAFILPLLIIFVFYDLISSEREAGRHALLVVTAGTGRKVWALRIVLRVIGLMLFALLPLWAGMLAEGAGFELFITSSTAIIVLVLFWTVVSVLLSAFKSFNSGAIAASLVGVWMMLNIIIPLVGKVAIESSVERTQGSEIALTQREAVNDAWDIPKSATMDRFLASHPEWADTAPITEPFHWKWYFAFQQVGDEVAAPSVVDYRSSILQRDNLTSWVALLSPAVAIQRVLQSLAATDVKSSIEFEDQVRRYHEAIRKSYYPLLFNETPFERARLAELSVPDFTSIR